VKDEGFEASLYQVFGMKET